MKSYNEPGSPSFRPCSLVVLQLRLIRAYLAKFELSAGVLRHGDPDVFTHNSIILTRDRATVRISRRSYVSVPVVSAYENSRRSRKWPRRRTSGNVSLVTSARLSRTIHTNIRRSAHVSCDMNNNLSGNYIESSPWVSRTSQTPRKGSRAIVVGYGSFVGERSKSYANMCRSGQRDAEKYRGETSFVSSCFLLSLFSLLCFAVCFWCSLGDIFPFFSPLLSLRGRIQAGGVNESRESTISVLSGQCLIAVQ